VTTVTATIAVVGCLIVGGLVARYAASLRDDSGVDPVADAEIRRRVELLRRPNHQRRRP
jgi:hypothetical protein